MGADGGGISMTQSTVTLDSLELVNNTASDTGGAIFINDSTVTLSNSLLEGNLAIGGAGGGLVQYGGVLAINDTTIRRNMAMNGDGGGAFLEDVNATITNAIFESNTASISGIGGSGGGLATTGGSSFTTNITTSLFKSNFAGSGGGIHVFQVALNVLNSTLLQNQANNGVGGGLRVSFGAVSVTGATIAQNTSSLGGGRSVARRMVLRQFARSPPRRLSCSVACETAPPSPGRRLSRPARCVGRS